MVCRRCDAEALKPRECAPFPDRCPSCGSRVYRGQCLGGDCPVWSLSAPIEIVGDAQPPVSLTITADTREWSDAAAKVSEGFAELKVIALEAEVKRLREENEKMVAWSVEMIRDTNALEFRESQLQKIIEGRTAPPTIAEARAHSHVTRGAFVVMLGDGHAHNSARIATGLQRFPEQPQRWWAIDANGAPCAWPVVASASAE